MDQGESKAETNREEREMKMDFLIYMYRADFDGLSSCSLPPLSSFPLPLSPPPLIPQAYYFDDSDDQSVSDINPLIRRPPSQVATCHTHIITGYLSAVEAVVLVRWKLDYSPIPTIIVVPYQKLRRPCT